jgi:hypothetical protein
MKLNKDPFSTNMNMVELDGKRVLVLPSQAKSTKDKEIVIGEERQPRMIKPKSPKDDQWQKNERSKSQRCPKATFDIFMAKYKEGRAGIRGHENRTIRNTKLDSPIFLSQASTSAAKSLSSQQMISDPAITKFRRTGSSSARLSSGALLLGRAINAWIVGIFTDDVSVVSSLGGVVWTMSSATDALPPRMVRTCWGF